MKIKKSSQEKIKNIFIKDIKNLENFEKNKVYDKNFRCYVSKDEDGTNYYYGNNIISEIAKEKSYKVKQEFQKHKLLKTFSMEDIFAAGCGARSLAETDNTSNKNNNNISIKKIKKLTKNSQLSPEIFELYNKLLQIIYTLNKDTDLNFFEEECSFLLDKMLNLMENTNE